MGKIIGWIVGKLLGKFLIVGSQISVSLALIGAHIILVGFFLYAIGFVYNKYNDLLNAINNMSTQSDLLSVAMKIMQSIGLINAFNDVFAIFSPFLVSYLVYRAGLLAFNSYEKVSNELFKVGVVAQE